MYSAYRYLTTAAFHRPIRLSRCVAVLARNYASDVTHGVHYETSLHKKDVSFSKGHSLPGSADVVVIGGGSVGCSAAYHLAKLNAGKVVLLEREKLTSGTTWHTAGILFSFRDGRALTLLQLQTHDLLTTILPEETGYDSGWIQTGGLYITRKKDQLDGLEKKSLISSEYGIETRMVDHAEMSHLHPLLNTKGIIGAVYSPHDGTLDPATLCTSYIKAATKYGAQVFEKCEVTGIKTSEGPCGVHKVTAVETSLGTIKTENILNCTGAWAPYLAKMVGIQLPQLTYKHTYVITQGIPGIEKTPHIRDTENRMYHKRQGDALLFGGYEMNPDFVGLAPEKNFTFGLYDMDWERFEQFMNATIELVPKVGEVGIRSTVCGPEAFTPDSRPLMGETQKLKGFYIASAFNSGGMMMGGGAGRQLAHWIVNGSPEYDMHECDVNRFTRQLDETWIVTASHDRFTKRFDIDHPYRQDVAGRNLRTTPLTERHISNGAYMNSVHGWEVPMFFIEGQHFPLLEYDYFGCYGYKKHECYPYRDQLARDTSFELVQEIHDAVTKESKTCCNSVGVVDMTHLSKFSISGSSADEVIRTLLSSNVTELNDNFSTASLLLSKNGGIVAFVDVAKLEGNSYLITAGAELEEFIMKHLNHFLLENNVTECKISNITDSYALLNVIGPHSTEVLMDVTSDIAADLQPGQVVQSKIGDADVKVIKSSIGCNIPIYEIRSALSSVNSVYTTLMRSSVKTARVGLRAFNSVKLETGHHDVTSKHLVGVTPYEANLTELCPLDDDREYIGKAALQKIADKPLKSKLLRLTASSDSPIFPNDLMWRNGVYAGVVEDAAYGCQSGKYHVEGYLKPPIGEHFKNELATSGNFTVGRWSRKVGAEIVVN